MSLVILDGNICSGKSTLIRSLKEDGFKVIEEDFSFLESFLNRLYQGDNTVHFELQSKILDHWEKLISEVGNYTLIIDRSPRSCRFFIELNEEYLTNEQKTELLERADILERRLINMFKKTVKVYIKSNPVVCKQRSHNRKDNISPISFEYLQKLHDIHEKEKFDIIIDNSNNDNNDYISEIHEIMKIL